MKILKKEEIIKRKQVNHTKTERLLLEKLNHPFIVKLIYAFQDTQKLYLVTEFMQGGELFFHLKTKGGFKEKSVRFYMSQVLLAIEYMHKSGYIHRDLKPENILLDRDGNIKLSDFGLSKMIINNQSTNTMCGTPQYLAPEICLGKNYDKSCDWFSFGILLYEMICADFPFKLKDKKIGIEVYKNKIEIPEKVSENAKDLILKLLEIEPTKRLGYNSADEIKKHPFFKDIDFEKVIKKEYKPPIRPKLNGELDLKYFDINFTEDNFYSEDSGIIDDGKKEKVDIVEKEEDKQIIESFEGFSFCREDENDKKDSDEEDDDDYLY